MKVKVQIPAAFECLFTPARVKTFHGGRGAAKSESIGRYLLIEGLKEPQNIVCGREYQSSIKESVKSMLEYLIEEMGLEEEYKIYNTDIRATNGTVFSFVGLHHNIANIKSMHNIKKFWGEEAQVFSKKSLDVLFPTIRAKDSELIFSMNPDLESDPAYQMLVVNAPPGAIVKKVNWKDNPYFPDVLRKEMEYMREHDFKNYLHIWEGHCRPAVEGAVYAEELQTARDTNRITDLQYDPSKPCNTYWDIGQADCMSIWIEQKVGTERYLIDFIQDNLKKVPYYIDLLQHRGYTYGVHVLPHDARQDRANAEFTTEVMVQRAFPNAKVVVNENFPGAVRTGIEAVRNIFPFLHFDRIKCADAIFSLAHYHYKVNPQTGMSYGEEPDHAYSDAPDALRTLAMAFRVKPKEDYATPRRAVTQGIGQMNAWWK